MRYRDGRRSICVSSQSGCPLTCTFCATGAMKFGRNLKASEILDQVLHFRRLEPVNHLVFMGMGEPFLNFDEVHAAALRLPDVGITHRRTTISTVGWMPGLTRFVDEVEQPIRLALSIHAADPRLRSELMPVNDRYPAPRGAGRVPPLLRAPPPEGLRRVRDARRRQRLARARARARRAARSEGLQGEPDPVQPDRVLRRLVARGDRRASRTCSTAPASRRRCGSPAAATSPPRAASSPRRASRWASRASPGAGRARRRDGSRASGTRRATSRRRRRRREARSDARPRAARRADARRARSSGSA